MIKTKHIVLLILFFICLQGVCLPPGRTPGAGVRFTFGPAYGFYNINPNHAKNPTARMSALVGFRKEIRLDREFKTYFLFGVDYFFHGVNFKSYYFKPDSLQLYDKTFAYDYQLTIQEINLPLQMKFSFTRENNSVFSPYIMLGYHFRYLLPGSLNITQNGNTVKKDALDLKFKNPLIYNKINSFVSLSLGWQKNSVNRSSSSFFVETNFRYGFSPYYFETSYSASSLFMSSAHLSLLLGLKF